MLEEQLKSIDKDILNSIRVEGGILVIVFNQGILDYDLSYRYSTFCENYKKFKRIIRKHEGKFCSISGNMSNYSTLNYNFIAIECGYGRSGYSDGDSGEKEKYSYIRFSSHLKGSLSKLDKFLRETQIPVTDLPYLIKQYNIIKMSKELKK